MTSAISHLSVELPQTQRTSTQLCDDSKAGACAVTAVALIVGSVALGVFFFGPVGFLIVSAKITLFGLVVLCLSCDKRQKTSYTHFSKSKPAPSSFTFRTATPLERRRASNLYVQIPPTARSPSPRPGTHFGRGHLNSTSSSRTMAPQFESASPDSRHFGRGHMKTEPGMHFGRGHMK